MNFTSGDSEIVPEEQLASRCSCRALAQMFHRLASCPQSSWDVHPDDDRAVCNVEQELDAQENVRDTFAASLSTAFLKRKLSGKACEMAWYAHDAGAQG